MKEWIKKYEGKIVAGIGMILVCGGTAMAIQAGYWKQSGYSFWQWFCFGTFSLIVIGTGVSLAISGTLEYGRKKEL